ncbi:pretoxin HINT domain-containing protein, putative [Babesia ovata]|uniref:Pretoxin HINT domain-containing protein, putative n=1 Tax=Babesia ovata TaxID=189622 RepID=A0A2H6KA23_9APIC|nr:pretoxin HINT domain-containing protein, putative [Babesia ovata]GBE59852.1 pretoxin HINT domain-containing protein, putative [Babesia ovata]
MAGSPIIQSVVVEATDGLGGAESTIVNKLNEFWSRIWERLQGVWPNIRDILTVTKCPLCHGSTGGNYSTEDSLCPRHI